MLSEFVLEFKCDFVLEVEFLKGQISHFDSPL